MLADGWVIKLKEAYSSKPKLSILGPHTLEEEVVAIEDDPFLSELQAIIEAVDGNVGARKKVLSSFEDALQTYRLTWKIRQASEEQ